MPVVLLILLIVGVAFGVGVALATRANSRRARVDLEPPLPAARPATPSIIPTRPPAEISDETRAEIDAALAPVLEEELVAEAPPVEVATVDVETVGPEAEPDVVERPRLRDRLGQARASLTAAFTGVRSRAGITEESWDELEEALLKADVGLRVTTELLDGLRAQVKSKEITTPDELLDALKAEMKRRLAGLDRELRFEPGEGPNVWLFVGVNGVGKTTTIGKVAAQQGREGRHVLLAAGDTFRAAAVEQLTLWSQRLGCDIVTKPSGTDPASVAFAGCEHALNTGKDIVIVDTAGRLQTSQNLMQELTKIHRVIGKKIAGAPHESLLVLDATTGQNGLSQAKNFSDATQCTGLILAKLDGTAKGGVAVAIRQQMGIPVKYVGVGEGIDDLQVFSPDSFVDALFA